MRLPIFGRATDDELTSVARRRVAHLAGERRPVSQSTSEPEPEPFGGWVPRVPDGTRGLLETDDAPATDTPFSGAIVDRLPLPLRGLWERWEPGLKRCRVELGRGQIVVVVFVLVAGLAIAAVVYSVARPDTAPVGAGIVATGTPIPSEAQQPPGAETDDGSAGATDGASAPDAGEVAEEGTSDGAGADGGDGMLVVHVAGKVGTPGVVKVPAGSRVIDAIEAAGGADEGVDLTPLNLARVLADGEQVLVGVEPPPGHEAPAETPPAPGTDATAGGPINLNTASVQQLETLPGIGPALAQRILDWRDQNGQFTTVDELQEVSGIGPSKFADISPLVTV